MHRIATLLVVFIAISLLAPRLVSAVTIETVLVSPPGETAFQMGTFEITNSQYVEFLNQHAKSLSSHYNSNMTSSPDGGIIRNGTSGSYSYEVKLNMGNKPVNYVRSRDALQFANWMHNGQGQGSTSLGSYDLSNNSEDPPTTNSIERLPGATWVVPTEQEWNWAAQGISVTTPATANAAGDVSNPGPGVANYDQAADWNGVDGNVTTVGSAGNTSQWGTYDQRGNVTEWVIGQSIPVSPFFEIAIYGGHRGHSLSNLFSVSSTSLSEFETANTGIRLANVPEPSSVVLAASGLVGLLAFGWRRRKS